MSAPQVIHSTGRTDSPPDIRFIHFNDVYNIGESAREPIGGASRFISCIKQYRDAEEYKDQSNLLVFFSGDAYNPSLESTVTKGKHMPPILNAIGIDAACAGNHDFDFSPQNFSQLGKLCNFPWLAANLYLDGKPIGDCEHTKLLTTSNGIKIGVIGLVEEEWIATVNSIPPNVEYKDAAAVAKELIPKLKEEGAELIVAITHAREPNDVKLAKALPEGLIDIILGGHDHFYGLQTINNIPVLRSGTDFKNLSYLEARRKASGQGWDFDIIRRDITSEIPEDPEASSLVNDLTSGLKAKMEKPIGITSVPLDSKFTTVRTKESNIGNFACDVMRYYYNTDCVLMASGTIRGDVIYEPGILKIKDLLDCFPFQDPCVVIRIKGKDIILALENSFSKVPALEGRFPQVAGMEVVYDPDAEVGKRVKHLKINHEDVDEERLYTMATREYMQRGKEGFDMFPACEVIVNEEAGLLLSTLLRQYFLSLKVLGSWCSNSPFSTSDSKDTSKLRRNTLAFKRFHKLQDRAKQKGELKEDTSEIFERGDLASPISPVYDDETKAVLDDVKKKVGRKWQRLALGKGLGVDEGLDEHRKEELTVPDQVGKKEGKGKDGWNWCKGIAPVVEGRIKTVSEV